MALMEDTGWYLPNYDLADNFKWGRGYDWKIDHIKYNSRTDFFIWSQVGLWLCIEVLFRMDGTKKIERIEYSSILQQSQTGSSGNRMYRR